MQAKSNHEKVLKEMHDFTKLTKGVALNMHGLWTYESDYFSWPYLQRLLTKKIIVLNKNYAKYLDINKFDEYAMNGFDLPENGQLETYGDLQENGPWYYKNLGEIMNSSFVANYLGVEDDSTIFKQFPKTYKILGESNKRDIVYWVQGDWWGSYLLSFAALTGNTFCEKIFTTDELHLLPEYIQHEKPTASVLSCINSDPKFPLLDIDLKPIVKLFDYPGMDYFKLLFVEKYVREKPSVAKEQNHTCRRCDPPYAVDWVLAYTKNIN